MAYADGAQHWVAAPVALFGALAIQIATNLVNDYADFSKGADTSMRKGPVRVTQAGILEPRAVIRGAAFCFALAAVSGIYLVSRAGWPILLVGILSIASGYLYTAGPRPLGYLGLGDLFVLIFFGPVAVGGTYYVQALDINWVVIASGFAPGLLSVALLSVNNLRDVDEDRAAGKRTLAVRFGPGFARWEYVVCVVAASCVPIVLVVMTGMHVWSLVSILILLPASPIIRRIFSGAEGLDLVPLLGATARLSMIYASLFSFTWII
jgi:1,4-dihydroxy-2-naphthoate octaprenyltransferase